MWGNQDHPGSFLSTVESPVAQATAKRLNRKAEDSEPYLAILEENWYDSVDSLKRLGRVGQPCTTSSPSCRVVFFDMLIQFGPIRNRLSVLTSRWDKPEACVKAWNVGVYDTPKLGHLDSYYWKKRASAQELKLYETNPANDYPCSGFHRESPRINSPLACHFCK